MKTHLSSLDFDFHVSVDFGFNVSVAFTSFSSERICAKKNTNSNQMRALEVFGFKQYLTGPSDHPLDAQDGMSESML